MLAHDQMQEFMSEFTHKLHGLCQIMSSVRYESLPACIPVSMYCHRLACVCIEHYCDIYTLR